jgi:hypothetical protein
MPRCPRCAQKFASQRKVLAHMSQPKVTCRDNLYDLVRFSTGHQRQPPPSPVLVGLNPDSFSNDVEMADPSCIPEDNPIHGGAHPQRSPSVDAGLNAEEPYKEEYIGASASFARGPTLMDKFDSHEHAHLRKENLYYPFASRQDWEMALFLLQSSLSMDSINEFLSLELVSNDN